MKSFNIEDMSPESILKLAVITFKKNEYETFNPISVVRFDNVLKAENYRKENKDKFAQMVWVSADDIVANKSVDDLLDDACKRMININMRDTSWIALHV